METNKVLSALCYFSVLFAGFIFPIVVYFVTNDSSVKSHAKKALLSHLIPLIPLPLFAIGTVILFSNESMDMPAIFIIGIILSALLSLIVLVWNIIKGVMVLKNE